MHRSKPYSRQQPADRFAGIDPTETGRQLPLHILGTSAMIHDDPVTASALDEGVQLQPWYGDETVLVDRYDARLLLDDLSQFDKRPRQPAPSQQQTHWDVDNNELEDERYRDLDYSEEYLLENPTTLSEWLGLLRSEDDEANPGDSSSDQEWRQEHLLPESVQGNFTSMPFYYSTDAAGEDDAYRQLDNQSEDQLHHQPAHRHPAAIPYDDEPYVARFDVPSHLLPHLPMTERQHKILLQTARFVSTSGQQMEVVLRVRQANNPNFTFLLPDDRCFPYYRWIVESNPKELPQPEVKLEEAQAGLVEVERGLQEEVKITAPGEDFHAPLRTSTSPKPSLSALLQTYGSNDIEHPLPAAANGSAEPLKAAASLMKAEASTRSPSPLPQQEPGVLPQSGQLVPASPRSVSPRVDAPIAQDTSADTELPLPPPNIKGIIDKLVKFVAKNGIKFEATVRQRERDNPKFSFLQPGQPHHQYYRHALVAAVGEVSTRQLLDALPSLAQPSTTGTTVLPVSTAAGNRTGTMDANGLKPGTLPESTQATAGSTGLARTAAIPAGDVAVPVSDAAAATGIPAACTEVNATASTPAAAAVSISDEGMRFVFSNAAPAITSQSGPSIPSASAALLSGPPTAAPKPVTIKANPKFAKIVKPPTVSLPKTKPKLKPKAVDTADMRSEEASPVDGDQHPSSSPVSSDSGTSGSEDKPSRSSSRSDSVDDVGLKEESSVPEPETEQDPEKRQAIQLQRRLRARMLLGQQNTNVLTEQQRAEQQQRARAILHHRHFFLRADEEDPLPQPAAPPKPQPPSSSSESEEGEVTSSSDSQVPQPAKQAEATLPSSKLHPEVTTKHNTGEPAISAATAVYKPTTGTIGAAMAAPPSPGPSGPVLPNLKDLVAQAAAAAAAHREAFERSLRDPEQIIPIKPPAGLERKPEKGSAVSHKRHRHEKRSERHKYSDDDPDRHAKHSSKYESSKSSRHHKKTARQRSRSRSQERHYSKDKRSRKDDDSKGRSVRGRDAHGELCPRSPSRSGSPRHRRSSHHTSKPKKHTHRSHSVEHQSHKDRERKRSRDHSPDKHRPHKRPSKAVSSSSSSSNSSSSSSSADSGSSSNSAEATRKKAARSSDYNSQPPGRTVAASTSVAEPAGVGGSDELRAKLRKMLFNMK